MDGRKKGVLIGPEAVQAAEKDMCEMVPEVVSGGNGGVGHCSLRR